MATHLLVAAVLWPLLPDTVPIHFGLAGEPDRWSETTVLTWFFLPAISTGTAFLLWGIGRLVVRTPETWNLPDREAFLRLTDQQRAPVMDSLLAYLGGVSILTTLLFLALHVGVYTTAVGFTDGLPWYIGVLTAGSVALILGGAVVLRRRIDRQIAEGVAAARGSGGSRRPS